MCCRKEDISLLAEQFIARFNRLQKISVAGITTEALSLLMAHDWPGNIRKLEYVTGDHRVPADGVVFPSCLFDQFDKLLLLNLIHDP